MPQSSLLKKIYIEGIGLFAYTVNNSIEHNMTTILLSSDTCDSVKEALQVRKQYTLCRFDERTGVKVDLRKYQEMPTRLRGLLSDEPEMPWTLSRVAEASEEVISVESGSVVEGNVDLKTDFADCVQPTSIEELAMETTTMCQQTQTTALKQTQVVDDTKSTVSLSYYDLFASPLQGEA